jgi:hypothetical protein
MLPQEHPGDLPDLLLDLVEGSARFSRITLPRAQYSEIDQERTRTLLSVDIKEAVLQGGTTES